MKRFVFSALLAAATLGLSAPGTAEAQATKFAYINSQKIMMEAPGAAVAQKAFEQDMTKYRGEIDKMGKEIETMQGDFEKQRSTLSEPARQQRQQEIQTRVVTYQQRVGELEQTAQRRQAELVQPIMKRISEVIEEIRKEGSYAMIFDASAGALITADPALDLTDSVVARLKTSAQ
jgi:outer membrane protein